MLAFILWTALGAAFILFGIFAAHSKKEKAFGFWANAKMFPVKDVRAYNRSVGKLWIVFGAGLILLGIPLLGGKNSPYALLSVLGIMIEAIAAMAVYVMVIEKKYRK